MWKGLCEGFILIQVYSSNGSVWVHEEIDINAEEYRLNLLIAHDKARRGHCVCILPTLHEKDIRRRQILFDAKHLKNPDLRIDGHLYEVESPSKPYKVNNLKNRIAAGAEQANRVIVELEIFIDINQMRRASKAKFIDHKDLELIEFKYKETYTQFHREDFNYDKKEPLL
jgi:hypothetical protein